MTNRKINIAHAILAATLVVIGVSVMQPPLAVTETADLAKMNLARIDIAKR